MSIPKDVHNIRRAPVHEEAYYLLLQTFIKGKQEKYGEIGAFLEFNCHLLSFEQKLDKGALALFFPQTSTSIQAKIQRKTRHGACLPLL